MLMFKGKKSLDQVKAIANKCGAINGYVQVVEDTRGYARYLIHMDNPEKAQYDIGEVTALGQMMDWCIEQGCYSFYRLSLYARANRPDWFRVITSSRTVFLTAWLKSMHWEVVQGNDIADDQKF